MPAGWCTGTPASSGRPAGAVDSLPSTRASRGTRLSPVPWQIDHHPHPIGRDGRELVRRVVDRDPDRSRLSVDGDQGPFPASFTRVSNTSVPGVLPPPSSTPFGPPSSFEFSWITTITSTTTTTTHAATTLSSRQFGAGREVGRNVGPDIGPGSGGGPGPGCATGGGGCSRLDSGCGSGSGSGFASGWASGSLRLGPGLGLASGWVSGWVSLSSAGLDLPPGLGLGPGLDLGLDLRLSHVLVRYRAGQPPIEAPEPQRHPAPRERLPSPGRCRRVPPSPRAPARQPGRDPDGRR